MSRPLLAFATTALVLFGSLGPAKASRQKPGPVFIRGTVTALSRGGFTLNSPSKGSLAVATASLTTYWLTTKRVAASAVLVGSHVGVHGYLSGSRLKAIKVTIYVEKGKPKEYTVRGTVIKAGSTWIDVADGGKRYHFVLAPGAGVIYRLLPAKLSSGMPGQRVDVRYYQSGRKYLATRIELLIIHLHHPRTRTEYGTVGRSVPHSFVLETLSGSPLTVLYSGHVFFQEQISVRGWAVRSGFEAEKVRRLAKLPVHTLELKGIVTAIGSGWVEVGSGESAAVVEIEISTHVLVSSLPGSASSLKRGQYISARFWWQGKNRVATSIHVYAKIPIPRATGAIKGTVIWVHRTTIGVHASGSSLYILVPSYIHIRNGSHAAGFSSLKIGETISVRYYSQGNQFFATSIHIYAGTAKTHTFSGTVLTYRGNELRILDRGAVRIVFLSRLTTIHANGRTFRVPAFKTGQKVRITGSETGGRI